MNYLPMHPDDMAELVCLRNCALCAFDGVIAPSPPCAKCTNLGGDEDHFERHEWLEALADRLQAIDALRSRVAEADGLAAAYAEELARANEKLRGFAEEEIAKLMGSL